MLTSERLFLRPIVQSDCASLFSIYGDPKTNAFNPSGPYPDLVYTQSVLDRWTKHWDEYGFGHWAIISPQESKEVIGFGGITVRDFLGTEINNLGYRLGVNGWGKGFATEFCRTVIEFGFNQLGLTTISATVRENHIASQRVLEKAGLHFENSVKDIPDAPKSLVFNLSKQEWQATSSR
ncbi:GNAT family N-acetyltransferase [Celerinatantimonas yamalensis]|uniref:GNAT family N-acetyltransferase n=1 Tax=Celerinatantimonas yamalensis TaxID=559956 RepID=A0ABW9G430_9GAMM